MYLYKSTLSSIDKTKAIADSLYKLSRKGDVFALYGDIGVGKTTFVRYFISNATKTNYVPSPSYNIYTLSMIVKKLKYIIWMLGE